MRPPDSDIGRSFIQRVLVEITKSNLPRTALPYLST